MNIKNSLKSIHNYITITPTDKIKNNFRFTCTEYIQKLIYHKITSLPTLLFNLNTTNINTPETTSKITYENTQQTQTNT
jgi:hypothetical protein